MNHLKAISIKFVVISIVLYSILASFYAASLGNIFIMSLLVTGVAYVIGDLFILPRFGNLIATAVDFGLSFISIWLLSGLLFQTAYGIVAASLFSALLIGSTEALFHLYMQNKVLDSDEDIYVKGRIRNAGYFQTEFSEENPNQDFLEPHKEKND